MRLLSAAGAALLVIALVGCAGGDPEPEAPDDPAESATTETGADANADEAGEAEASEPCNGLTTEALTDIFGLELTGPKDSRGNFTSNDVKWTSVGCKWKNETAGFELAFDFSGPSDFADGTIACLEPVSVGDVTPVADIGDQAWWSFRDFDEIDGELRVCTTDSLTRMSIDTAAGSVTTEALQQQVVTAMRIVVG